MPRLNWSHRQPAPIPRFRPGQTVILDNHPPGVEAWTVVSVDGSIALLEAVVDGKSMQVKRWVTTIHLKRAGQL